MNDRSSLVKLCKISPMKHSYGEYKKVDIGKTAFIGRDETTVLRHRECPYSESWVFKKAAQNEISLVDDISEKDMMKVVGILSHAERKVIVK